MASAPQEVKKMKQGMSYSCKEKTIILNVFKYFRQIFPEKCVTELVKRTAKATGCSEKSVFQFRKEEASAEGFKEPSKTKIRKNLNINSRYIKYDNTVRDAIRTIIYDLKYKNIIPSLKTILKCVNTDRGLPTFSLMTLRRLLFDMGFTYEKNGNKSILVEKLSKNSGTGKNPVDKVETVPLQNVNNIVNVKPVGFVVQNQSNVGVPIQTNINSYGNRLYQENQIANAGVYDSHGMAVMMRMNGGMHHIKRDVAPLLHHPPPPPPPHSMVMQQ